MQLEADVGSVTVHDEDPDSMSELLLTWQLSKLICFGTQLHTLTSERERERERVCRAIN